MQSHHNLFKYRGFFKHALFLIRISGISICILSYDGAIRIVLGVDSSIFKTQEMLDEFTAIIENEFYELRNEIAV